MLRIHLVCSGGGLRTIFFAGFIRGFLDALQRQNVKHQIASLYTVSGSALTVPAIFTLDDYDILTFLDVLNYRNMLVQKATNEHEAKVLHGIFDFSDQLRAILAEILKQGISRQIKQAKAVVLNASKKKHEYLDLKQVDNALDSARFPVLIIPHYKNKQYLTDGGVGHHIPVKQVKSLLRKNDVLIICDNHSPPIRKQLIDYAKIFGRKVLLLLAKLYLTDPVIKDIVSLNKHDNTRNIAVSLHQKHKGISLLIRTYGKSSMLPADRNKFFALYSRGKAEGFYIGSMLDSLSKHEFSFEI